MLTCYMMRFHSIFLLGLCPCGVLHVCMLRGCEGDGNAGVGDGGGVVLVSAVHMVRVCI